MKENIMTPFFEKTFRPFFLITGIGTATVGLYAFFPIWSVTHWGQLNYIQEYTIITQHWGIMVGLMGLFMMWAALKRVGRTPILLYSAIEKIFMAYLVLSNSEHSFSAGFRGAAIGDTLIVLYTIAIFAVKGFDIRLQGEKEDSVTSVL